MSNDLDRVRRNVSVLVDAVIAGERQMQWPEMAEGYYDNDRNEALDILNRIERRIRSGLQERVEFSDDDMEATG